MTGVQTCALPIYAGRDPAWTADGIVAETWAPISPVTGQLDAFQWRVPVTELETASPLLIAERTERLVALGAPRPRVAAATASIDVIDIETTLRTATDERDGTDDSSSRPVVTHTPDKSIPSSQNGPAPARALSQGIGGASVLKQ